MVRCKCRTSTPGSSVFHHRLILFKFLGFPEGATQSILPFPITQELLEPWRILGSGNDQDVSYARQIVRGNWRLKSTATS